MKKKTTPPPPTRKSRRLQGLNPLESLAKVNKLVKNSTKTAISAVTKAVRTTTKKPISKIEPDGYDIDATPAPLIPNQPKTAEKYPNCPLKNGFNPTYQTLSWDSSVQHPTRSMHNQVKGNPPGDLSHYEWNKVFNAADSRKYKKFGSNAQHSDRARFNGDTRKEAIDKLIKIGRLPENYDDTGKA